MVARADSRGDGRRLPQGRLLSVAMLAAGLHGAMLAPARAEGPTPGRYLFDALKLQPWRGTYAALVAPLAAEQPWIAGHGVDTPAKGRIIEGHRYELFARCKPHDCADNQLRVLFSRDGTRAMGAFRTPKGTRFLGKPDTAARKELMAAFGP